VSRFQRRLEERVLVFDSLKCYCFFLAHVVGSGLEEGFPGFFRAEMGMLEV
jgi:hypothetical protein